MLKRAYSTLQVKAVDEDSRTITGIATSVTPDRMGDIVEPKGAVFKLPIPLLWQHKSDKPIGRVTAAKVGKDEIEITATLAKIDEPGALKDRLDEAWQSIKAGLVRGLSIGFNPLESAQIKDTWSVHFQKWEWLELSAVTIPANADAGIATIRSIDQQQRGASRSVVRLSDSPGASGLPSKSTQGTEMNYREQIESFAAKRAATQAKMADLMTASATVGETLDTANAAEFDTMQAEIDQIDKHLARLKSMEAIMVAKASVTVVESGAGNQAASGQQSQQGNVIGLAKALPPGIAFARYVKCLAAGHGDPIRALAIAENQYKDMHQLHTILKAAVAAGTTTDATWAAPLIDYVNYAGDFINYLRPMSIIGKFGANGIPSMRAVPFNVKIPAQTTGGDAYWVGEGAPKPLTKFDFTSFTMTWSKVANIAVLTEELIRFSSPSAEALVRDALAEAIVARLDADFINPLKGAVAGVSPASITNGASTNAATGTDADAARRDVATLMGLFATANLTPESGVWIMSAATAIALSLQRNTLGQVEFPGLTMQGGTFLGMPVIVSQYVPSNSNGSMLILANASDIYLADDGMVTIDASREASLQMLDNPTNATANGGTATTLVSMFQTNSVALRAERYINWKLRRSAGVAYISGVNYAAA